MSEPTPNVVSISGRKAIWTPEDALAVAAREPVKRLCIVVDRPDGSTVVFSSTMTAREMLWQAEMLRMAALDPDADETGV